MSARFKTLRVIFFFLLSFATVTLVWGEGGYLERKEKEERLERLEAAAESKERENALLRERNLASKDSDEAKVELIYSFSTTGKTPIMWYPIQRTMVWRGNIKAYPFQNVFYGLSFLLFSMSYSCVSGKNGEEREEGK